MSKKKEEDLSEEAEKEEKCKIAFAVAMQEVIAVCCGESDENETTTKDV